MQAWTTIALLAATLFGVLFYLGNKIDSINSRIDHTNDRISSLSDSLNARIDKLTDRVMSHLEKHPS